MDNLSAALDDIRACQCTFVVGGRLMDNEFKEADPSIIPTGHEDMFSFLTESEFR